jgi:hypothetical protein
MRVTCGERQLLGLCASVMICSFEPTQTEGARSKLVVTLRRKSRSKVRYGHWGG